MTPRGLADFTGIGGRCRLESVAALLCHRWQTSSGILTLTLGRLFFDLRHPFNRPGTPGSPMLCANTRRGDNGRNHKGRGMAFDRLASGQTCLIVCPRSPSMMHFWYPEFDAEGNRNGGKDSDLSGTNDHNKSCSNQYTAEDFGKNSTSSLSRLLP